MRIIKSLSLILILLAGLSLGIVYASKRGVRQVTVSYFNRILHDAVPAGTDASVV